MTNLVTLAEAKLHLRVDHDLDDNDIELKIAAASNAVLNYLGEAAEEFVDSSGELIMTTDSPPVDLVPRVVKQATLLLLGDFYKNREPKTEDPVIGVEYGFGHLPRTVIALLYHYRTPTLR